MKKWLRFLPALLLLAAVSCAHRASDDAAPVLSARDYAIVIPDEECGYDGRGDWHFDDFTPTPGEDEEVRK